MANGTITFTCRAGTNFAGKHLERNPASKNNSFMAMRQTENLDEQGHIFHSRKQAAEGSIRKAFCSEVTKAFPTAAR